MDFNSIEINLNDYKFVSNDILEFQNVVDEKVCKHIIDFSESIVEWQHASVSHYLGSKMENEISEKYRKAKEIMLTSYSKLADVDSFVNDIFTKTVAIYANQYGFLEPTELGITHDEGYHLVKYDPSDYFKQHYDGSHRVVSGILYLNEDFQGGETTFERQNVKVKPKTGKVIIFPSNYTHLHCSEDIIEGTKYCLVTWWLR